MRNLAIFVLGLILGATAIFAADIYLKVTPVMKIASFIWEKPKVNTSRNVLDFTLQPDPINIYEIVDSSWVLTAPDQKIIPFHSFKGKVVFMSRWATWCGPCIEEMPEIAKLRSSLPPDEFIFMLYTDEQEHIVRSFDNSYNVPIYISVGYLPEYLQADLLPKTYIVDKSGGIQHLSHGSAMWSDQKVLDFMRKLALE